ncbi:alpha/beta hydrolase [Paenibacillus sp. N1-5-1-14]|uniref:alpha/beta fold hydrolase n=1 Tax=Paenibacillus radicibacter TaxID=2972488 RepID=UPI002158CAB8|nr:alpha/beta hydrolase [Paenibacillus radicibacter]MCR8644236.1 alpha/beta hydrolase [Paenibacillus radicibacter]
MHEPPFIVNDSRAPVSSEYVHTLNNLIAEGRRSDAVEYFMTEAVGVPAEFIEYMKVAPHWAAMESTSHTLAYDGMVMGTTQSGNPLPTDRWQVNVPVLIMVGENSGQLFADAAQALSELVKQSEIHMLPGLEHSAVVTSPNLIAEVIVQYDQKEQLTK